ncbi:hypothetical protein DPMN_123863 [Dreissena polymorpha]|uniref:Secreted protein n=1 Tax=Dreissena polymorpha TaxID=45954 RepID=A0A9D4GYB4_DREPO|nr:hypothetical protein DPMN_123863 [Dreissena polymorpha]
MALSMWIRWAAILLESTVPSSESCDLPFMNAGMFNFRRRLYMSLPIVNRRSAKTSSA